MAAPDKQSSIEDSDVLSLFPTLVWKIQLRPAVYEPINDNVRALIGALRENEPPLPPSAAWQSSHGLQRREEMRLLCAHVLEVAGRVLQFLRISERDLEITGCWANLYAPGAAHRMHSHPNNFLSAAYYVCTWPGADTINFHDPRPQTAIVRPPVTELTSANTDQVVVRLRPGTLLLFPSYLQHSVDANASREMRISVSLNLMFANFTETLAKPLWGEEEGAAPSKQ